MNLTESLAPQRAHRPAKLPNLVANDMGPEVAIGPMDVSVVAQALGKVENHRHWNHVVLAGKAQQRPPGILLYVRGVYNHQLSERQALAGNVMEDFKRLGW